MGRIQTAVVHRNSTRLFTAIALAGFGNSNIFPICFAKALTSMPDKQNEVSGLMIMGLFGGTIFPLIMGFAADAFGQSGAVAVIAVGVAYLLIRRSGCNRSWCGLLAVVHEEN